LPLPNLSAADAFPRLPYPLWLPGGCTVFCYRTLMQSGERRWTGQGSRPEVPVRLLFASPRLPVVKKNV